jgi:23S rRNA (cytosine1962-C5)-methyltransferase
VSIDLVDALRSSLDRRSELIEALQREGTDCFRAFHGANEGAPGVAIDVYGPILLVQTWRSPIDVAQLEALAAAASETLQRPLTPVLNHRADSNAPFTRWHDPPLPASPRGTEGGLSLDVRPRHRGRDPLFFLDLRAVRRRLRAASAGSVLNLFSYTGVAGLCAAAGGAARVVQVDFATSALAIARENAVFNGYAERQIEICEDFFPAARQFAGLPVRARPKGPKTWTKLEPELFDTVILDPPRWAASPWGAVDVVRDYPSLLKPALLATRPGGLLVATNHLPSVNLDEWLSVIRRTAEKCGRPVVEVEVVQPDADFPSPDGRHPLKIAWMHTR